MAAGAPTYAMLGALAAFPRRLAGREIARQGGALRGATARGVTHLVFGRTLLERMSPDEIARRHDAARKSGLVLLSENGFRRALGLTGFPAEGGVSRISLIEQSKLDSATIDLLSLFDAFESPSEPYSFRDVILARKYMPLIQSGTGWADIARSVHRVGKVASLTAVALHGVGAGVFVREGTALQELDGQCVLPFDDLPTTEQADDLFAEAEAHELDGQHARAAAAYAAYLALVPGDPVAAFNRANALRAAGAADEALNAYAHALKLDPRFAEAWFNCGSLLKELGRAQTARQHFVRAIALDAAYADPHYNLAALEYDAGNLAEARRHWARYLELDAGSEWAARARRGIQIIDVTFNSERQLRGGAA